MQLTVITAQRFFTATQAVTFAVLRPPEAV
jgi:hypothetical protein